MDLVRRLEAAEQFLSSQIHILDASAMQDYWLIARGARRLRYNAVDAQRAPPTIL